MVKEFQKEITEHHLDSIHYGSLIDSGHLKKEMVIINIISRYKEFFDQYTKKSRIKKFNDIVRGYDHRLSSDSLINISEIKEKTEKKFSKMIKSLTLLKNF
jgi:hypothetical protein